LSVFFGLYFSTYSIITYLENLSSKKRTITKKEKISILIPAYNEGKNIAQTISFVLNLDWPKEIIVIDDGSTDDTAEQARKFFKLGVKVFSKKNGGKADAINFGIDKCNSDFIFILDADSFPEKNCIEKMMPYFEDKRVAAVIPTLKPWNRENLIEKLQDVEYSLASFLKKISAFSKSLSVVPGAPIIRKKFLMKYGKFDKNNITEDFEMGLRIKKMGYTVEHALDAFVYTKVPSTLKKLLRQRIRWDYGTLYNIRKYKELIGTKYGELGFYLLPSIIISTIFAIVFAIGWPILLFNSIKDSIENFYLVKFDLNYFLNFEPHPIIITFKMIYLLTILSLALTTIIYFISTKKIREKIRIEYIIFIFFYGWLLCVFRFISLIYILINKKPKW